MCGRYMITSSFEAMARLFDAALSELGPEATRPNVSPTEPVLSTTAYAKQLGDADALIERVIRENRPRGRG